MVLTHLQDLKFVLQWFSVLSFTGIKEYSDWPTIPQVFINGDFVGGCDILLQMHQSGELIEELQKVGITSALLEQEMEDDKGEKKWNIVNRHFIEKAKSWRTKWKKVPVQGLSTFYLKENKRLIFMYHKKTQSYLMYTCLLLYRIWINYYSLEDHFKTYWTASHRKFIFLQ